MRQEAEERKLLLEQQKKVEKEESKYTAEMEKVRAQMLGANELKTQQLSERIAELELLLAKVNENKEKISQLQNGKAGCVYIISNLGSFGDDVFKIGMTRRLIPQERVDELGSASVPFSFDVHSFIFSADAPALETAIHHRLNEKRVNRVNLRKEFFKLSLDELELLVHELEPSAEFNRTMAAEQYRQSLSMTENFTILESDEAEDEE
ncbi:MAG: GIY-YIG nuclease family protein [Clostridia bacterium]|nr:GIY-YIG nuclease family protein [Clostridia bacterium]